jgi:RNA polymerase sigma-70 factor, ECF subfamily
MTELSTAPGAITRMLRAWSEGDRGVVEELIPLVYSELHRTARRYMAQENPAHTLQATALINETYLRLSKLEGIEWQNRGHFYAICARLMRRILADHARGRPQVKAGQKAVFVPVDESSAVAKGSTLDFVALDEALDRLAELDARQSQVVQLRYFVGLSIRETAAVLGMSERSVKQDWTLAKLWLSRELREGTANAR